MTEVISGFVLGFLFALFLEWMLWSYRKSQHNKRIEEKQEQALEKFREHVIPARLEEIEGKLFLYKTDGTYLGNGDTWKELEDNLRIRFPDKLFNVPQEQIDLYKQKNKEEISMPAVARDGDPTTTGHGCDGTTTVTGPHGAGAKVFANGIAVECSGDPTAAHTIPAGPACVPHGANINVGSGTVFVGGIAIARVGDSTDGGAITAGSPNVFAGG